MYMILFLLLIYEDTKPKIIPTKIFQFYFFRAKMLLSCNRQQTYIFLYIYICVYIILYIYMYI